MTSGARIADSSDVGLEKGHVKDNSGDKVRGVIGHDVWCDLEPKLHKLHLNNSKTIHMYVSCYTVIDFGHLSFIHA